MVTAPVAPKAANPTTSSLINAWLDHWRQSGTPKVAYMAEACRQAAAAQLQVELEQEKVRKLSTQVRTKETAWYESKTADALLVPARSVQQVAVRHPQPSVDRKQAVAPQSIIARKLIQGVAY